MASGHVNRAKRPNTWLHRPMLQNVKKALANSEPSTHGAKRTFVKQAMSANGRADLLGDGEQWRETLIPVTWPSSNLIISFVVVPAV